MIQHEIITIEPIPSVSKSPWGKDRKRNEKHFSLVILKRRYYAVAVVAIIVASLVAGYLIGVGKIIVPYIPGGPSSTLSSLTTVCSTNGETNGVILRVVQDNYSARPPVVTPVAGATITGTDVYFCGIVRHEGTFVVSSTNSSGFASLLFGGAGMYYLYINYKSPANYTVSVPVAPLATTFVTYNISTGNVTTSVCYYGEHC